MQKKILIIDDEPAVLDFIRMVIEEEMQGVEADFVSSLDEALKCVEKESYGAILSDFYLGRGNIIPLYLINRTRYKIPFALLSGEFPAYIKGWFLDKHIPEREVDQIPILGKPFDIDVLSEWIAGALATSS